MSILAAAFEFVTDYSKPGFWLWWFSVLVAALRTDRTPSRGEQLVEKPIRGVTIRSGQLGGRIGEQVD